MLCNKNRRNQTLIPLNASTQVLIEKGIIIAEGSRCCKFHLKEKETDKTLLDETEPNAADVNLNRTGILKIIESVRNEMKQCCLLLRYLTLMMINK